MLRANRWTYYGPCNMDSGDMKENLFYQLFLAYYILLLNLCVPIEFENENSCNKIIDNI